MTPASPQGAARFSLAYLTVFDLAPDDAVRVAAEAGYDLIGFRILPAGTEAPYALFDDDALLRRVMTAQRETGVKTGDVEIIRLKADNDWALFAKFLERCAALEARNTLIAGDDTDHSRLADSFARFCAMAEPYGLTADLEFMPWTAVPDLNTARAIVSASGAENGGVLIDALHFGRSRTTLADVAALPETMVHFIQLADGAVPYDSSTEALIHTARNERLFPGMGGIDLTGLIRNLPADITLSVEVPNRALAEKLDATARAAMALAATKGILRKARAAS